MLHWIHHRANAMFQRVVSYLIKIKKYISQVFRHGDNSPDNTSGAIYPNDPYKDRPDLFPMGYGELTEVSLYKINWYDNCYLIEIDTTIDVQ